MSAFPYMKFYPADYFADTRGLSTEQHGVYLLLLMAMWNAEGELPNDDTKLARFAGISRAKWLRHKPDVLKFFRVLGEVIRHKRLDQEIEEAREVSEHRAAAGRSSGEARRSRKDSPAPGPTTKKLTENAQKSDAVSDPKPLETHESTPTNVHHLISHTLEDNSLQSYQKAARDPPAFPADGAIDYSTFAEAARRHGRGLDVNILASAFRKFCHASDIRFDDPRIGRKFETFCAKHRVQRAA